MLAVVHRLPFHFLPPGAHGNFLKFVLGIFCWGGLTAGATGQPWQAYFAEQVKIIGEATEADLGRVTAQTWPTTSQRWREELADMLGLMPWPERTDLKTTVVGSISLDGVDVDRLHYQSRPQLYVAANLYKPQGEAPAEGWPAVVYVCGHARVTDHGRLLGNKTAYQHHGLWLARHGVVCLTIDTVQLGELHGEHHGTYKLGRWDWISRGYTPAGVEAWNAIRAVDLLQALPQVDGSKIGITGRSGGGAYSWFAAALDERIKAAVPVAGITDLQNHVIDGCVEGHCDCMYFVNNHRWDYGKLAALVAPRGLLLANSDNDGIFPLDGVIRIHRQLEQHYDNLGASENYGLLVTPGPHKDTQELQVGAFKWLLRHLTGREPVIDTAALKELEPQRLVVFETEAPADERVTSAGSWFAPSLSSVSGLADIPQPQKANPPPQFDRSSSAEIVSELHRLNILPAARAELTFSKLSEGRQWSLFAADQSPDCRILRVDAAAAEPGSKPMVHLGLADDFVWDYESVAQVLEDESTQARLAKWPDRTHYFVKWHGSHWLAAATSTKQKNQLVRRWYLVGQSPDQNALLDYLAAVVWLATKTDTNSTVELAGDGRYAGLAVVAGLVLHVESQSPVAKLRLSNYPTDPQVAPVLPSLLRTYSFADLLATARQELQVTMVDLPASKQLLLVDTSDEPQQANGMRIVEVSGDRAQVWVRATRWPLANLGDLPEVSFADQAQASKKRGSKPLLPALGVDGLRFAVPGVPAEVRVGYRQSGQAWKDSPWIEVTEASDFSAVVPLSDLQPSTRYELRTQTRGLGSSAISSTQTGSFRTLPAADAHSTFRLAVGTCQGFPDRDGPHGFDLYRSMLERGTDAFVMAGDVVYYDELARSRALANYHWQRTYSLPTLVEFHRRVPTFFLKDDHDTYVNDSWPGQRHAWTDDFTFAMGQEIFIQQTGLPTPAYRTFRVGKDLQVWLMEGRDFRSPNDAPDTIRKSIWGSAQKAWLKSTLSNSSAKFRVVISPTPIVGPDRDNKKDNHSNRVFETEGNEIRQFLAAEPNTVSVCGDRHWQFHSVDPISGLHEFSVGPASDRHAGGWNQEDYRPDIHQFLRVGGGYLEIELTDRGGVSQLVLRHLDTQGVERHSHTLQ